MPGVCELRDKVLEDSEMRFSLTINFERVDRFSIRVFAAYRFVRRSRLVNYVSTVDTLQSQFAAYCFRRIVPYTLYE